MFEKSIYGNIPSNSAIAFALSKELQMLHKLLKDRHSKTKLSNNTKFYLETALVQSILNLNVYETVLIDEIQINEGK